jgi:hypothetical protein
MNKIWQNEAIFIAFYELWIYVPSWHDGYRFSSIFCFFVDILPKYILLIMVQCSALWHDVTFELTLGFNMKVVALCHNFPTHICELVSDICSSSYDQHNKKVSNYCLFIKELTIHLVFYVYFKFQFGSLHLKSIILILYVSTVCINWSFLSVLYWDPITWTFITKLLYAYCHVYLDSTFSFFPSSL